MGPMMIVQRIRCYHYNKAFKVPFLSPQANRLRADSVIACIDCGPEGCGWGESAPRPYVTGESVQSVLDLWEHVFAPLLFANAFDGLDAIDDLLSELEAACQGQGHRAYHSALGAADLALIDVLRRNGGLEETPVFSRNYRQVLRYSVSVPFIDPALIDKYFPVLNARLNNPIIKLLVDADSDNNLRRIQQLRRLAGEEAEIRLEFNGKLRPAQVLREIDRLRRFHPTAVEQPLPAGDIEGLHRFRRTSGLAVIVDESVVSLADAQALLAAQACDVFNLKISKCGGLLRSRSIAQLAAQAGIACQVGTHVGESELLGAAGRQLARGIPHFDCYGGGSQVLFSRFPDAPAAVDKPEWFQTSGEPFSEPDAKAQEALVLEDSTLCLDLKP